MIENKLQTELKTALEKYLDESYTKYPNSDLLKIDLHCHDRNSVESDEILGRILKVRETWVPTQKVIDELKRNNCDVLTITNHNNACSCWELKDAGKEILIGAEFTCWVPDFDSKIHVLAYGFSKRQEKVLEKLRGDLYEFLEYTCANDIPTIWAHPLYYHAKDSTPQFEFFEKMVLIFERFEMLNGQRNTWQNMLVKEWIDTVSSEQIDALAIKHGVDIERFCKNKYKKSLSGGSDSHCGFFAGLTGSYLYIPDLQERLKTQTKPQLALEAIRKGDIIPYGKHENSEKLTITFIDYVSQIAVNYKDPGLMRLMLHQGNESQKLISLLLCNAFSEVQRHKVTMSFINEFHHSFLGKVPAFFKKVLVKKAYKPVFNEIVKMAQNQNGKGVVAEDYYNSIYSINQHLNELLFARIEKKITDKKWSKKLAALNFENLIEKLEFPSNIRAYIEKREKKTNEIDFGEFVKGLPFPFFASALILSAHFTSARVLYNTRPFLKEFSKKLGKFKHPERAIWLSDTFEDKNGVCVSLKATLKEIRKRNLPIDILVCSNTLKSEDNLIVLKPLNEFVTPLYPEQPVRIPNFVELHNLFQEREYDRIICSTEGIMGAMAFYLKQAFSVPASFYIHTDWVMFSQKILDFDEHNKDRFRRMLRLYYGTFDKLFVLNRDQEKWLIGREMNFPADKVCLTAHWVSEIFKPEKITKKEIFGIENDRAVLLYVGRISKEKGVLELPKIYKKVKVDYPNTALVVVGSGPVINELKSELPDAYFLDWVEREKLPKIYSAADVFVFPSKFDTFANVVLESLSCATPVIAYDSKGPKDIIENGVCGYCVKTEDEICEKIVSYLGNKKMQKEFRKSAVERSKNYNVDKILSDFMQEIGF